MKSLLQYLLYPNPVSPEYTSTKVVLVLAVCAGLIVGSIAFSRWRQKHSDTMFKKLSAGWATAARWFGVTGLVMIIARVEGISYVSIRVLWVFWLVGLVLYIVLQLKIWRAKYYRVVRGAKRLDPRSKYLPNKK